MREFSSKIKWFSFTKHGVYGCCQTEKDLCFLLFSVHLVFFFSDHHCLLGIKSCSFSKLLLKLKCFHLLYTPFVHLWAHASVTQTTKYTTNHSNSHHKCKSRVTLLLRIIYAAVLLIIQVKCVHNVQHIGVLSKHNVAIRNALKGSCDKYS